jgi:hypothetical protein
MLTITADLIRRLLDSPAEQPVLYIDTDSETPKLGVWAGAYVNHNFVVITRTELTDWLGNDWTDSDLQEYLPELQQLTDNITDNL